MSRGGDRRLKRDRGQRTLHAMTCRSEAGYPKLSSPVWVANIVTRATTKSPSAITIYSTLLSRRIAAAEALDTPAEGAAARLEGENRRYVTRFCFCKLDRV